MMKRILLPTILAVLAYGFWISPDFKEIAAGVAIFLFGMLALEEGFKAFTGGLLERLLRKTTDGAVEVPELRRRQHDADAVELAGVGYHHFLSQRRPDRPGFGYRHHFRCQPGHDDRRLADRRLRPEGQDLGLCDADAGVRRDTGLSEVEKPQRVSVTSWPDWVSCSSASTT